MIRARSHVLCRFSGLRAALLWAGLLVPVLFTSAMAQSVWELTPYRVQVVVVTDRSPQLTPQFEENLSAELLTRVAAVVGAPWDVVAASAPDALRRSLIAGVEDVPIESLPDESSEFDKVMLLVVEPRVTGYQVTARDLDVRTQIWNAPVRMVAWQAAKLRDTAFRAMCEAFAPLAQVGTVDTASNLVTLRLRAAAFPTRDRDFLLVRPGDLFQPVVRYNDREGNPRRITIVPWTYLEVDAVVQAALECKLRSGLRSPMTGRLRGRVERLALGVVPPQAPTRLILKSRVEPERVLAGYDVYVQALDSKATEFLGRSDRRGSVTIQHDEPPIRLLVIKHGGILLARLPMVPGIHAELDALIADDEQRLEAEGYLAGLQQDLVDLVTRRHLLLARARARLEADELDEADEVIRQLQALKTRDEFGREVAQQRKKTFASDPAVQRQIDTMFGNTEKVLRQFLDSKPIENLTDELAKAR